MWSLITLSAILTHLSYNDPDRLGWLFIVGIGILVAAFTRSTIRRPFRIGFVWGALFYGLHFIWFLHLLFSYFTTPLVATFSYGAAVCYYAATAGVWLFAANKTDRWLRTFSLPTWASAMTAVVGTGAVYSWFVMTWSVWFAHCSRGYPFLSPAVPLVAWLSAVGILAPPFTIANQPISLRTTTIKPLALPTDWGVRHRTSPYHTPAIVGNRIRSLLVEQGDEGAIIVAPETAFPFPLNEYPEFVRMWQEVLQPKSSFVFGTLLSDSGDTFQVIMKITQNRITPVCRKCVMIDLAEREGWAEAFLPQFAKTIGSSERTLCAGADSDCTRFLCGSCFFEPRLCADAFFLPLPPPSTEGDDFSYILASVNDSWFIKPFARLLRAYLRWQSWYHSTPILYVSYLDGAKIQ